MSSSKPYTLQMNQDSDYPIQPEPELVEHDFNETPEIGPDEIVRRIRTSDISDLLNNSWPMPRREDRPN